MNHRKSSTERKPLKPTIALLIEIRGLNLFISIGQIDEVKLSSSRSKVKIFHIKFDAVSRVKWPSSPCFF